LRDGIQNAHRKFEQEKTGRIAFLDGSITAGGGWKRGHFHCEGKRPLADLWLTMAQRAGLKQERFADSS